jgi:predicted  nucleic acid-binding Zn-ribbon protein
MEEHRVRWRESFGRHVWAPSRADFKGIRLSQADTLTAVAEKKKDDADLALLRKAESVLAEIDRTSGLIDRHADVLAALRIRIEGGPRKSLEELMEVAGDIKGKSSQLDERLSEEATKSKGDLADMLAREPKKKKSLDDLL